MHRTEQLVKCQNASKELLKIVVLALEDKRLAIRVTLRSQFLLLLLFALPIKCHPPFRYFFTLKTEDRNLVSYYFSTFFEWEKCQKSHNYFVTFGKAIVNHNAGIRRGCQLPGGSAYAQFA